MSETKEMFETMQDLMRGLPKETDAIKLQVQELREEVSFLHALMNESRVAHYTDLAQCKQQCADSLLDMHNMLEEMKCLDVRTKMQIRNQTHCFTDLKSN